MLVIKSRFCAVMADPLKRGNSRFFSQRAGGYVSAIYQGVSLKCNLKRILIHECFGDFHNHKRNFRYMQAYTQLMKVNVKIVVFKNSYFLPIKLWSLENEVCKQVLINTSFGNSFKSCRCKNSRNVIQWHSALYITELTVTCFVNS